MGDLFRAVARDAYEAAGTMYARSPPYDGPAAGLLVILLPVPVPVPVAVALVALATSTTLHDGNPVFSVAVQGLVISLLSTTDRETRVGPYFALFLVSSVAFLLASSEEAGARGPREGRGASDCCSGLGWPTVRLNPINADANADTIITGALRRPRQQPRNARAERGLAECVYEVKRRKSSNRPQTAGLGILPTPQWVLWRGELGPEPTKYGLLLCRLTPGYGRRGLQRPRGLYSSLPVPKQMLVVNTSPCPPPCRCRWSR